MSRSQTSFVGNSGHGISDLATNGPRNGLSGVPGVPRRPRAAPELPARLFRTRSWATAGGPQRGANRLWERRTLDPMESQVVKVPPIDQIAEIAQTNRLRWLLWDAPQLADGSQASDLRSLPNIGLIGRRFLGQRAVPLRPDRTFPSLPCVCVRRSPSKVVR
jgi:hypothetical protein